MDKNRYLLIQVDMDSFVSQSDYYGLGSIRTEEDRMYDITAPRLLDHLDRHGLKATFFVSGKDFISNKKASYWMEKIVKGGHEIANHSFNHVLGMSSYPDDVIRREVTANHLAIKERFGYTCVGFRVPGYDLNSRIIDILKDEGYLYDSSSFPTSLAVLYKVYHALTAPGGAKKGSSGMGPAFSFTMEGQPYTVGDSFVEIPVATTRYLKIPLYLNFHLCLNEWIFKIVLSRSSGLPVINYVLHATDFLDIKKDGVDDNFNIIVNAKKSLSYKSERFNNAVGYFSSNGYKNILSAEYARKLLDKKL